MNHMKSIAIIGAGITGLRAALNLTQNANVEIVIWDKATSVGGRVATRRFGPTFVNHGALLFDEPERVFKVDPEASEYAVQIQLKNEATTLPKSMRDHLLKNKNVTFRLKEKVLHLSNLGQILSESGDIKNYDHVLVTTPEDQTREMMKQNFLKEVKYSKKILFIGELEGKSQRFEMDLDFSEQFFSLEDDAIRKAAASILKQDLSRYDLKKWRYAQVLQGVKASFVPYSPKVTFAGDAFDPSGKYNLAAAWLSGYKAAQFILEELKEIP